MDQFTLRLQHEKDLLTIENNIWHGSWLMDIELTYAILRELEFSKKEDEYLSHIQDNLEEKGGEKDENNTKRN